ncbi:T cell receptor beta chain MC.7.G5-like [Rhineura floridana]|uniref:T cell receptor beta chain MC.7.G5-like n=1 Tax=Rhineura floridana TaxID=261503 RepID=UPI002AC7FABB|nr:T cell receptor beta chain MC.7.G5-like [Rhineura floridana]
MMSHLRLFLLWLFAPLFLCDGEEQVAISQVPRWVMRQLGGMVKMDCYQTTTDDSWMFWYQQKVAEQKMEPIGILIKGNAEATIEERFRDGRFEIGRDKDDKHCSLQINKLGPADAALYFCASATVQQTFSSSPQKQHLTSNNFCGKFILVTLFNAVSGGKLNFGKGTRLTVLETGQVTRPPRVTIFAPASQELQEKQKATIVCLATDFFPDHVTLSWAVNDEERTAGVKTEEPVLDSDTKTYSLISRLRITQNEWHNSDNTFLCRVEFYNETGPSDYDDGIYGVDCDGSDITKVLEPYLREANIGKLVYIILIFKSTLYGMFVMGLKLRRKYSIAVGCVN